MSEKWVGLSTFCDYYLKTDNKRGSSSYLATIGCDTYIQQVTILGLSIRLNWWLMSLNEGFKFYRNVYTRGSDMIMLMYDITRRNSITKLHEIIQFFQGSFPEIPILLVGNKSDLKEDRQISPEETLHHDIKDAIAAHVEISAETGENVIALFELIARYLIKKQVSAMENYSNSLKTFKKEIREPRKIVIEELTLDYDA
jgi:GTPase SAR1 family protein